MVSVWAQNQPIDSDEDARCSAMKGLEVDPQQYVITVGNRFSFLSADASVKRVNSQLRQELIKRGYTLLDRPLACSLLLTANPSRREK